MLVQMLKSKIHRCRVTAIKPDYEGSLALDRDLVGASGLLEYEKILVANLTNGERFETYVILAPKGSGEVSVNGAAARLCRKGDELIVMSFGLVEEKEAKSAKRKPVVVRVDRKNRPVA
jgi:aspartate 1-decarboxylase